MMECKRLTRYFRALVATAFVTMSASTACFAATYYIAPNGSDSNLGTISSPFRTIQKGLNTVQPGDTCTIRGGTYNESLVLGKSGTSTAKIIIQNYTGETVTINSGSSIALRANGRKHYYEINGFRFISTYVGTYSVTGRDYTLDFENGVWDGKTDPNGGNNGFTVRNCYVEGAIHFYGHNNTVESCELNGKSSWTAGIMDWFAPSHHNTYRGNTIYSYKTRGVWSMQYTDTILVEKNVIHDIADGMGVDIDGAGHPCTNAIVRGNTIYKIGGRGIEMENAFNSITEDNIIYNCSKWGISQINYGLGPDFYSDAEYRDDNTNSIIRNNVVYATAESGIALNGSPGNKILNNTVYGNTAAKGYYAGISLNSYGGYPCVNTVIANNILSENKQYALWIDGGLSLSGLKLSNNLYYHSTLTKTHNFSGVGSYTLTEYRSKAGQEQGSLFANPAFANPASGNFHLTDGSPGLDAGDTLTDVPADLEGNPRPGGVKYDMGAYEKSSRQVTLSAPQNLYVLN